MAGQRYAIREVHSPSMAASGGLTADFYFPRAVRVLRYYAVPTAAEAAHATQALVVTFTNKGTAGAGSTLLATLTNDSDVASAATVNSGAWAADDAKEIDTQARPTLAASSALNVHDSIAAGSVVQVVIAKAAGTATGFVTAGMEFEESS